MKLKEMLKSLDKFILSGSDEIEINSIEYDSRQAINGSLFIAMKGLLTDGHKYIEQAVKLGAKCIIVEDAACFDKLKGNENITSIYIESSSKAMALIANAFYGYPANDMTLIGITGTNGKTTTTYIIKSILESAGKKVGIIGTIGYWIGEDFIAAEKTTPESVKIFEMLKNMKDHFVDYVVMEASSIALELDRIYGLKYDVAAFTNLTQDHLDFHNTFEKYFNAKKILFDSNLKPDGIAVYNADDLLGRKIAADFKGKKVSYGLNTADFTANILKLTFDGMTLSIKAGDKLYNIKSDLTGKFNAYNILLSASITRLLGIDDSAIVDGIAKIKNIDGRFTKIKSESGFWCIVDYSHTPDSLKNALETINQILDSSSKVITVFGCGGNRDKTKRPIMGKIAVELSDVVIVTSDNPRFEEPDEIIRNILTGISKNDKIYVEPDRKKAIAKGISLAKKGDVVLVAGKGHETYQDIKGVKNHFDDSEIINEIIKRTN